MRVVMVFVERDGIYSVICVYGEVREYYYAFFSCFNKFIIHKKQGRRSIKKLLGVLGVSENLQHANCSNSLEYIKYFFNKKKNMNILRIYEKEV